MIRQGLFDGSLTRLRYVLESEPTNLARRNAALSRVVLYDVELYDVVVSNPPETTFEEL